MGDGKLEVLELYLSETRLCFVKSAVYKCDQTMRQGSQDRKAGKAGKLLAHGGVIRSTSHGHGAGRAFTNSASSCSSLAPCCNFYHGSLSLA